MLHFHSPDLIKAEKLSKVGKAFVGEQGSLGRSGSFPPKKSREVYQLIKEGNVQSISLVEWGSLFRDDFFWQDQVQPSELDDVILTIFAEVESNAELRSLVIINAVMTIEYSSNWLPEDIMCRFNLLMHSLQGKDLLCFKLIHSLNNGDYDGLTVSLIEADATPIELLDYLSWPKFVVMKENLETSIIERFTGDFAVKHETMVCRLFDQFEKLPLVQLIDTYVHHLKEDQYPESHIEWLKQHIGPAVVNDIWSRINPKTRTVLARVLDINNYPIYYKLIQDLAKDCSSLFNIRTSQGEGLSCHERAVQRMAFWSNYSESMITSQLLLEPNLYRAGKEKVPSAPTQLLNFKETDKLKTNWICIEFENLIVVDQLTSSNGAVRIFNKSLLNENRLLANQELTSNDIVMSIQDDLHDHSHLWQSSLEERLRINYSILPNLGTKRFEGIKITYVEGVGLKKPPQQQLNVRISEVERWEKSIISFEMLLGKYETEDSLDSIIETRLSAMLRNDQEVVAVSQLRGHCKLNKRWAYEILSSYLLTKPNGSVVEREEGQVLYSKMVKRWGQ
jgi:hypothetical protein